MGYENLLNLWGHEPVSLKLNREKENGAFLKLVVQFFFHLELQQKKLTVNFLTLNTLYIFIS